MKCESDAAIGGTVASQFTQVLLTHFTDYKKKKQKGLSVHHLKIFFHLCSSVISPKDFNNI